ncbi:MAG: DUF3450 family protein [Verrucomicrobiota bacterium]
MSSVLCGFSLSAQSLDDARSIVSEWVEVEKTISEERAEWKDEEALIVDMIALLETEKTNLEEKIEAAEEGASEADKKRQALVEESDEYRAAVGTLSDSIVAMEATVIALHQQFPSPLQEEVSKLYTRIPQGGEETRLSVSQRLQSVIAILSQADKFNGGVQLVSDIQQLDSGQAEVDVLYFGLAGAFFQDREGTYVGVGFPSSEGWVWEETPEKATEIAKVFAVYAGEMQAEFVNLPVKIK